MQRLSWLGPALRWKLVLIAGALLLLVIMRPPSPRGGSWVPISRTLLAGLAVVAVALLARQRAPAKRFNLPARLGVAGRVALSSKCSVALVEADGQSYLVAFGDGFAEVQVASTLRGGAL